MPSASSSGTSPVNRHADDDDDTESAREAVRRYVPSALRPDDWQPVAEFTRAVALDIRPVDRRRAIEAMRTLSQFVVWAHRQGIPLEREKIFTPDVVGRYIAVGCSHLAHASRATRRSDLRRFSTAVTRRAPWAPLPARMRADYAIVPYTHAEVDRLLEVAEQQRTPTQRRRLTSTLALGLGTGIYPRETWRVTTDHLVLRHGHLCLEVPGDMPRTIPITPPHDTTLDRIRRDDPGSTILGFIAREWDRSRLWHMIEKAEIPADCPPIRMSRLRATWMLDHLQHRVHLNALAQLAGVTSWKSFGHLMGYLPPFDEADLVAEIALR
ncbi:site-specific integrase [Isoptericola sp. NPDC055881]